MEILEIALKQLCNYMECPDEKQGKKMVYSLPNRNKTNRVVELWCLTNWDKNELTLSPTIACKIHRTHLKYSKILESNKFKLS